MKTGRVIRVRSEFLRNIRTNLRKFFYKVLEDRYDYLLDQCYAQSSFENIEGMKNLEKARRSIYELLYISICRCHDCNSFEKDAVFFSEEVFYPLYYPPVDVNTRMPNTYWLCPDCYQVHIKKLEEWKKDGYYIFQDGVVATLEQLGLEKLEDYYKK